MSKLIIGCDPDSNASGIAAYVNGSLFMLECMSLIKIYQIFDQFSKSVEFSTVELHIEDIHGRKATWQRGGVPSARRVGRCEQVQVEIERIAKHFDIDIVHHPVSGKWKTSTGKAEFLRYTGWGGESNEDSRSAAYFGYAGLMKGRKNESLRS